MNAFSANDRMSLMLKVNKFSDITELTRLRQANVFGVGDEP